MNRNRFQLARLADVADPDGPESPGAEFLSHVAYEYEEHTAYCRDNGFPIDPDYFYQFAYSAVPVYTHERWQTFTDLCAYNEVDDGEIDGLPLSGDLTEQAGQVLYAIAIRLLYALHAEEEPEA